MSISPTRSLKWQAYNTFSGGYNGVKMYPSYWK